MAAVVAARKNRRCMLGYLKFAVANAKLTLLDLKGLNATQAIITAPPSGGCTPYALALGCICSIVKIFFMKSTKVVKMIFFIFDTITF